MREREREAQMRREKKKKKRRRERDARRQTDGSKSSSLVYVRTYEIRGDTAISTEVLL